MDQLKIQTCVRIADEYRVAAETKRLDEDTREEFDKLTWRAAFPDTWSPTLVGRLGQVAFGVCILPLVLLCAFLIAPLINHFQARSRKRRIAKLGREYPSRSCEGVFESIHALWRAHGLSEPPLRFSIEQQAECLERWVTTLYGGGITDELRVRSRVLETRTNQSRAYAEMAVRGGYLSFVEAAEVVARDLSKELPPFGQIE